MEHDLDLVGYLENNLSENEKEKINHHLRNCPECRQDLADHQGFIQFFSKCDPAYLENLDIFMESPDKEVVGRFDTGHMMPLPEHLQVMIREQREENKEAEFKQSLTALKTRIANEIDQVVSQIIIPAAEPGWALDKEETAPSQTDLALRIPSTPKQIRFQLKDYEIEINQTSKGTIVEITESKSPVSEIEISVKTMAGQVKKIKTDGDGRIQF